MTGYLWAALGIIVGFGMTALGDMASEEIRDRLDHLPHAILRLAALRLDPRQHVTIYQDEWLPELTYILKGAEARPITRLIRGTKFAIGILISAARIARHLDRKTPAETLSPHHPLQEGEEVGELMDEDEVATMFRVGPKTVTRWARAGRLTSIRTLGGHRRYRESEVRALIAGIPQQRSE